MLEIALYAVLTFVTLGNLYRVALVLILARRQTRLIRVEAGNDYFPPVTVQLPVFNEASVVERLIEAVCALDYPRNRLEIQVLDDSTDETTSLIEAAVGRHRANNTRIHHLRRSHREGFKAGALAEGLKEARGELIAIFDADFVPGRDFLTRTVGAFRDESVGLVQARWNFLNEGKSPLTKAQALFLDAHFLIEHPARFLSGGYFHFNGTAGVWRRSAIDDAGGWSGATLTEDLDLSYRARLRGWQFIYLPYLSVPSELPEDLSGLKAQQFRWVKGMVQVAKLHLPAIWKSEATLWQKLDATGHLTSAGSYLTTLLGLTLLTVIFLRDGGQTGVRWVGFNLGWTVLYYALAGTGRHRGFRLLGRVALLIPLGVALSVNGTRAVISGLFGSRGAFERTPKRGSGELKYISPRSPTAIVEGILGAACVSAATASAITGSLQWTFPLLILAAGFCYLTALSIQEWNRGKPRDLT